MPFSSHMNQWYVIEDIYIQTLEKDKQLSPNNQYYWFFQYDPDMVG